MQFTDGVLRDARSGKIHAKDVSGTIDTSARSGRIYLPAGRAGLNLWLEMLQAVEPQLEILGIGRAIVFVEADGHFKILNITEDSSASAQLSRGWPSSAGLQSAPTVSSI